MVAGEILAEERVSRAERLTSTLEWDNKAQGRSAVISGCRSLTVTFKSTGKKLPPGEESMDFEKDQFEDDEELSRLEEDDELGGETIIEAEEEILTVEEEPAEEAEQETAARPAPKATAKKPAPKAAKKPAKKAAKKP